MNEFRAPSHPAEPKTHMRYLLIIAMVLSGMTFMAPQAEAGGRHYRSYRGHGHYSGHHHHGYRNYRPARVVYGGYYRPSYYRSYYRPAYYSGYDYCAPRYRSYYRPRISLSFGF